MDEYPQCLDAIKPIEMTLFNYSTQSNCQLTSGTLRTDSPLYFSDFPPCANKANLASVRKYVFLIHGFNSWASWWANKMAGVLLNATANGTVGVVTVNWKTGAAPGLSLIHI